MPLARGDKEYVLPTKGLNTEANVLHFPQDFAVDVLNMEADYSPQVIRPRKGMSKTGNEVLTHNVTISNHDIAITGFLWEAANEDPDTNFIIVQTGRYLNFFDASLVSDPTTGVHTKILDLNDFLSGTVEGTLALAEPQRVEFANVKGKVMMCSNQIEPSIIRYDGTNITGAKLVLQQRDITGIDDGLAVDEIPTSLTDDHKYNLYNQGWYKQRRLTSGSKVESDPITEYNTQWAGEYPSNADIVYLGMVDSSGDLIFDAELMRDQSTGSSPAPRGHYVLDIFNKDRASILASPLGSGTSAGGGSSGGGSAWVDEPVYDIK